MFCGLGNNGGDGLAIARLLHPKNYKIEVIIVRHSDKQSEDFSINLERLKQIPDVKITEIIEGDSFPVINSDEVVIDSLFGSGLTKPVKGFTAEVIEHLNNTKANIISIDVPSGLFCDESSIKSASAIIKANYTLTFQLPKLAFLLAENEHYVGSWKILPIGLSKDYINNAATSDYFTDISDIHKIYKPRNKFSHKGNYGHALLVSGSYGKMGAAVLASKACLRSGVGLLTTHVPKCGYLILQSTVPEAMVSIDYSDIQFSDLIDFADYNAVAVGPGIGTYPETQKALNLLIEDISLPLIIDADAINILGENRAWLTSVPKNSIFTPHPKEFERLTKKTDNNFYRLALQKEFSVKYGVYVILKGAHTAITTPEGNCYFNPTGNPGMATAGSGDVLTGILLGLMAQNYNSFEASVMAVFIHGLAGDIAACEKGYESLIAGDIIQNLGNAFRHFSNIVC